MITLAGWRRTSAMNVIVYRNEARPYDDDLKSMNSLPGDISLDRLKYRRTRGKYNYYSGGTVGAELYGLTKTQLEPLAEMGITTIGQLVLAYQNGPDQVTEVASKGRCSDGRTYFVDFMDALLKQSTQLTDPNWTPPVIIKLGMDSISVKSLPSELNPANYDASVLAEIKKNLRAKVIEDIEPILVDAITKALKAKEDKTKKALAKVKALKK